MDPNSEGGDERAPSGESDEAGAYGRDGRYGNSTGTYNSSEYLLVIKLVRRSSRAFAAVVAIAGGSKSTPGLEGAGQGVCFEL